MFHGDGSHQGQLTPSHTSCRAWTAPRSLDASTKRCSKADALFGALTLLLYSRGSSIQAQGDDDGNISSSPPDMATRLLDSLPPRVGGQAPQRPAGPMGMVQSAPFPHDSRSFHFAGEGILPLFTLRTPQQSLMGPATHRSLNPSADRVVFSISPYASECHPQQVGPRACFASMSLPWRWASRSGRRPGMLRSGQSFLSLLFRSDFLLLLDHRALGGGLHLGSQSAGPPGWRLYTAQCLDLLPSVWA